METRKNIPIHPFPHADALSDWLAENHLESTGIWIKFAKKNSGIPSVTYEEAREAAIRHGWIDGLIHPYDDRYFLRLFTCRKPKSGWSKINRTIAEALMEQGRMSPAGLAQVEAAKKDGRWDVAYDSPSKMTVPEDFQEALTLHPAAAEFFSTVKGANRYAFLYRIQTARTPKLRAQRIEKFIEMLEAGELLHPLL